MKPLLKILLLGLLLSACEEEGVQIRLHNQTGADWQSAYVNSNGNEQTYAPLPAGEYSDYKTYPAAYPYGLVRVVTTGGDTLRIIPRDYLGATLLEPGKYTYRLTHPSPNSPGMGLELE